MAKGEFYSVFIEQFTGLFDRNGKEIYEGDILEFDPIEWGSSTGNRWKVKWNHHDAEWNMGGGLNNECSTWKTVIGNIHEHPHLLVDKDVKMPII